MTPRPHTCIFIEDRETDYSTFKGQIPYEVIRQDGNWEDKVDFDEKQKLGGFDTEDCVWFAFQKAVDAQINQSIESGVIPKEQVDWFDAQGYLELSLDGSKRFHSSPVFGAILSGVRDNGTPFQVAGDFYRANGVIPWKVLPFDGSKTGDAYYDLAQITQAMRDLGKEFMFRMGGKDCLQYHWVYKNAAGGNPVAQIQYAMKQGPVVFGVAVCQPWDQEHPPTCPSVTPQHALENVRTDSIGHHPHDNYIPFMKILGLDYQIPYVMQMVFKYIPIPTPPPPQPPVSNPPTAEQVQQAQSWMVKALRWILGRLQRMQGARFAGEPPRSSKWPEVRKAHLEIEPDCQVCGCKKNLNVHHIFPFHLDQSKELDPDNLITLCQDQKHECHLRWGHFGNYATKYNPNIKEEAPFWLTRFTAKTEAEAVKVENQPTLS